MEGPLWVSWAGVWKGCRNLQLIIISFQINYMIITDIESIQQNFSAKLNDKRNSLSCSIQKSNQYLWFLGVWGMFSTEDSTKNFSVATRSTLDGVLRSANRWELINSNEVFVTNQLWSSGLLSAQFEFPQFICQFNIVRCVSGGDAHL